MNDKTLGAYERNESPDYADGGVAAALIEQEAEEPTAEVRELRSAIARELARGNALQDALDAAPDAMTAREHLDAAWEAAHVPADGIIPEGRMFLDRGSAGVVVVGAAGHDLESRGSSWERRLVDPPAPARPEGAEELEDLLSDWFGENDDPDQSNRDLADHLIRKGVRVVTEEDPR